MQKDKKTFSGHNVNKMISTTFGLLALGLALVAPTTACAGESSKMMNDTAGMDFFGGAELASDRELENSRGAADTTFTAEALGVAVLNGIAANNNAAGSVTGNNSISRDAFSNASGVSFVVQNSGNNAVVNAAMVINLSIQ